jgi:hypothetical protein
VWAFNFPPDHAPSPRRGAGAGAVPRAGGFGLGSASGAARSARGESASGRSPS